MKVRLLVPFSNELVISDLPVFSSLSYTLKYFDERTISFLNKISRSILTDDVLRKLPEIVALGFWMRRSNILRMKGEVTHSINSKRFRLSPVGKVFHICPANVDTMFVYSIVVSLLMGNRNVVRISERVQSDFINRLFTHFSNVMMEKDNMVFNDYVNIITYGHDTALNDSISNLVNARMIWGGDETVRVMRSTGNNPRCRDILFSDRVSAVCLDSKKLISLDDEKMNRFITDFYNDAYTFDQMGCSSPQTVFFVGDESVNRSALRRLIDSLTVTVRIRYAGDIFSISSLKLNRLVDDVLAGIAESHDGNGLVRFVELSGETDPSEIHGCGGGYFYWRSIARIDDLFFLRSTKVQTISHFGLDMNQLNDLFALSYGEAIDRIVPVGKALSFDYLWDGYDLFEQLSRKVYIE
jgi:hypothetical protein